MIMPLVFVSHTGRGFGMVKLKSDGLTAAIRSANFLMTLPFSLSYRLIFKGTFSTFPYCILSTV